MIRTLSTLAVIACALAMAWIVSLPFERWP